MCWQRRVPMQCWAVMRRTCPYGEKCPYRAEEGLAPLAEHWHVWAFPVAPLCIGLKYSKAMFAEHARDGIEMRAPRDWEELLKWAKILTDPENNEYGMKLNLELPGWYFTTFLYSAGGQVVQQDEHGNWRCTIATEEAAKTMWFFARMKLQQVEHDGQTFRGVAEASYGGRTQPVRYAMELAYLDERFLDAGEAANFGFGPVPKGPTGLSRSEFNAKMCGSLRVCATIRAVVTRLGISSTSTIPMKLEDSDRDDGRGGPWSIHAAVSAQAVQHRRTL